MSKLLLLTALLFFAVPRLYSQSAAPPKLNQVATDEKYLLQVQEVYGSDYETLPGDIKAYLVKLLSERIRYEEIPFYPEKDFPLLSSLPLMNEDNPSITGNPFGTFDENTFRPLHYGFNFFSREDLWFRIDGTNYVMLVEHFNP